MCQEHLDLLQQAYGSGEFVVKNSTVLSGKGGNYLGVVTAVSLQGKTRPSLFNLILKTAQSNKEAVRSTRAILPAFQREVEVYQNVLPSLLDFQAAFHLSSPFVSTPAYYASSLLPGKEALVLEDLRQSGFELRHDLDGLDFEHQAALFQEYAKLHALSLAFRAREPEKFSALTSRVRRNFLEERAALHPELYEEQRQVVFQMGRKAVQGQQEQCHKRFEVLYLRALQEGPEEELLALCHGDCHPNNIMFKYSEQQSKPQSVALIDWQLSSLASPMRDLTFAFFACASKEVLKRPEELLEIYYSTLCTNLQEFGCDPEKVLSLATLKKHWGKYSPYGLYRAQVVLKLMLITPEQLELLGESSSILEVLRMDFGMESKFAQRVRGLFESLEGRL